MYDIKQGALESAWTGEEVTLNPNFYGVIGSDNDGKQFSLKSIQNMDSTVWLPEEAFPSGLEDYELPVRNKIAVGIHRRGNDMVVETEGDSTPSYDYPLIVDVEMTGSETHLQGMIVQQNFSINILGLPLWQYLEIQSLSDLKPIEEVILEVSNLGESDSQHTNQPVSIPDLPDIEYPELLEYMRNVGRAADAEIMLPAIWPPGLPQVVNHYRENFDLTREVARDLLQEIDELTEDVVATMPSVSILDAEDFDEESGDYGSFEHERLGVELYGFYVEIDEESGTTSFLRVDGSDSRYDRKEIGHIDGLFAFLIEETAEEAFELFLDQGTDAVFELSLTQNEEEASAVFEMKRQYGPKFTWYYLDKFHFTLFEEQPPHLQDSDKGI